MVCSWYRHPGVHLEKDTQIIVEKMFKLGVVKSELNASSTANASSESDKDLLAV